MRRRCPVRGTGQPTLSASPKDARQDRSGEAGCLQGLCSVDDDRLAGWLAFGPSLSAPVCERVDLLGHELFESDHSPMTLLLGALLIRVARLERERL
jgi:hypothetical protein